jgi:hypothetical protein
LNVRTRKYQEIEKQSKEKEALAEIVKLCDEDVVMMGIDG